MREAPRRAALAATRSSPTRRPTRRCSRPASVTTQLQRERRQIRRRSRRRRRAAASPATLSGRVGHAVAVVEGGRVATLAVADEGLGGERASGARRRGSTTISFSSRNRETQAPGHAARRAIRTIAVSNSVGAPMRRSSAAVEGVEQASTVLLFEEHGDDRGAVEDQYPSGPYAEDLFSSPLLVIGGPTRDPPRRDLLAQISVSRSRTASSVRRSTAWRTVRTPRIAPVASAISPPILRLLVLSSEPWWNGPS